MLNEVAEALKRREFEAVAVSTKEEALVLVMKEVESAASVGWGGSETIKEIGARQAILDAGREIRDHRTDCDLFLLSANALTRDGRIVNVDGTGNRVAASVYGPKRVVCVVGRNKIVDGGIDAAIERVRGCAVRRRGALRRRRGMRFAGAHVQGDGHIRQEAYRPLREGHPRRRDARLLSARRFMI